jgi:hypothetical protein
MSWKRVLLVVVAGLVVLAGAAIWAIGGPSMLLGMIRYDERREGALRVGEAAPDVALEKPDGSGPVSLSSSIGGKPLVLVLGSYT